MQLIKLIDPAVFCTYVENLGWKRQESKHLSLTIYNNVDQQITIPLDKSLDDYGKLMESTIERFSFFTKIPEQEFINQLIQDESFKHIAYLFASKDFEVHQIGQMLLNTYERNQDREKMVGSVRDYYDIIAKIGERLAHEGDYDSDL